MTDPLDEHMEAAEAQGRRLMKDSPVASAATFDPARRRIVVEFSDGRAYAFPPHLVEDLAGADPADLAEIVVDGAGLNLHWPRLDVDLFVPDLLAGVFGTKAWMRARLAGPAAA